MTMNVGITTQLSGIVKFGFASVDDLERLLNVLDIGLRGGSALFNEDIVELADKIRGIIETQSD